MYLIHFTYSLLYLLNHCSVWNVRVKTNRKNGKICIRIKKKNGRRDNGKVCYSQIIQWYKKKL